MKNRVKALRLGFNWRYRVSAVNLVNGESHVVIDETLLLKQRGGFVDRVIHFNFCDYDGVESDICAELNEFFDDLRAEAEELGMVVHSGSSGPWGQFRILIEGARMDSPLITGLAKSLSSINRVSVEFDLPEEQVMSPGIRHEVAT